MPIYSVPLWTTEYQNRKVYETQEEATTDLYEFGGEVVTDYINKRNKKE